MSKLQYVYNWYDHFYVRSGANVLGIEFNIKDVESAILTHNWDKFRLYRFLLDEIEHYSTDNDVLEFFPNTITIWDGKDVKFLPLNKENFMLITNVEHECG